MTDTGPRPQPAAMLPERPAPAALRARAHTRAAAKGARALCAGEARSSGNGSVRNREPKGSCDALRTTVGPAQTAGAEAGPMTKHDIP